jgi:hypothetical protein
MDMGRVKPPHILITLTGIDPAPPETEQNHKEVKKD